MIQNYDHTHQIHVQTKHNPLKGVKIHGFKTSSLDILKKKSIIFILIVSSFICFGKLNHYDIIHYNKRVQLH